MNNTRKTFWVLLILLLAVVIILALHKKQALKNDVVLIKSVDQTNADSAMPATNGSQRRATVPIQTNMSVRNKSWVDSLPKEEKLRLATAAHNVPIDFWGKVIDQDGVPLGGVKVVANARFFTIETNGMGATYFPKTNLVTGLDGLFEIHGMMGDVLTIEALEKDGYETEPGALRGFGYNTSRNITPDQSNPVIFRLWKKDIKQSLISGDKFMKIIPDGRPYAIDLMTDTINEAKNSEGDLQIWAKRPDGMQDGQRYYEWSFGIRSQDGGVLQELDGNAAMFLAPTDGYSNIYEYKHPASHSGWGSGSGDRRFYVKIRGNLYGRFVIAVNTFFNGNILGYNTGDGTLSIHYTINPSGSPILR